MKRIIPISIFLTLLTVLIAVAAGLKSPLETEIPADIPPSPAESDASPEPLISWRDAQVNLRVSHNGEIVEMTMESFISGVVAAEMPVSFEAEALAAQAVAARTYALYKMRTNQTDESVHPDADVCTDYTHCAAYAGESVLRDKWGADYDVNMERIIAAVNATDGVYLTYGAEPIFAAFHSSSHGATENSEAVWGKAFPYLVSVPTPETEDAVPNLISTVTVSPDDFKNTVLSAYPAASFGSDTSKWVGDITYELGRVVSIKIGGAEISGTQLRALFGLRSTAVLVEITEDAVIFTTSGYGHGVGMSQYGANCMARSGANWREILKTYYSGADFSDESASI